MKSKILLLPLLFLAGSLFAQFKPDYGFVEMISMHDAMRAEGKLKAGNPKLGNNYDLGYCRLDWRVDPSVLYISGKVTSVFKAVAPVTFVEFELDSLMAVDSVWYHQAQAGFIRSGNLLKIFLPSLLPAGQIDSVSVFYQGAPQQGSGFGSFIQDSHAGVPVIWTLSEPYGAKEWWPCKNSLSDKIDSVDILVSTPAAYRAGSNGTLKNEITIGGNTLYHWKHRYPIATYLIAIAVTNYSVYSDYAPLNSGTLEILNYVFPESLTDAQSRTPDLIPVMQLYDSLFFDYPYMNEKYGHAQFNWGGGMEHQTMTILVDFGYELMAHELAHQWFGDKVTCGSWRDIWINEGFATYLTALAYDFITGDDDFRNWKRQTIADITSQPDGSVYCYDTTSVWRIFDGRLSYNKGAMVLNMLRWKIGDPDFFAALYNFMTDPGLAYGFARTEDFRSHAEAASGQNLSEFFNDWIYQQGYPTYSITATVFPDKTGTVSIVQASSHPSVSFFNVPVPLFFRNALQDTMLVFDPTYSGEIFNFTLGFMPDSVKFDPNYDLIALSDTTRLVFQVQENAEKIPLIGPNPVNEGVFIRNLGFSPADIVVADESGREVFREYYSNPPRELFVNLRFLSRGIYFMKISTGHNILYKKIVKA